MKHNYEEAKIESFVKTLIVGAIVGFALSELCHIFGWI